MQQPTESTADTPLGKISPTIVLAAGGTGGHVFPAEALARELLGRGVPVVLITDKRGSRFGDDVSIPIHRVHARNPGNNIFGMIRAVGAMAVGAFQANYILKKIRPAVVVGFGGYPSLPTLCAAARLGIPIVLHEQNAIMGRANRALLSRATMVATSFPQMTKMPDNYQHLTVHTGNPVRPIFAALRSTPYNAPTIDGDEPIRLLVFGGSQGARIFGHVVPRALALLPEQFRRRLMVTQQCRPENIESARAAFAGAGIEAELSTFIHDMPERMAASHLVICRSGGATVAELTAIGRPAILAPLPYGHAGEQFANAEIIAAAGGAWIMPDAALTPESLAKRLEALFALPINMAKTAAAARAWGNITAADKLADCVLEIVAKGHF